MRTGLIAAFLDWLGKVLLGRTPYESLLQECEKQKLNGYHLSLHIAENERLRTDNRERMVLIGDLTRQLQAKIAVESVVEATRSAMKPISARQLMGIVAKDMENRMRALDTALDVKPNDAGAINEDP